MRYKRCSNCQTLPVVFHLVLLMYPKWIENLKLQVNMQIDLFLKIFKCPRLVQEYNFSAIRFDAEILLFTFKDDA